jgi:hypothetical protein
LEEGRRGEEEEVVYMKIRHANKASIAIETSCRKYPLFPGQNLEGFL